MVPPTFISVVAYKGGVGKTTLSILLGCGLALFKKKRTLLVDLDPQANLTEALLTQTTHQEVLNRSHYDNKKFSIEFFYNPVTEPIIYGIENTDGQLFLLPSSHKYMKILEYTNIRPASARDARGKLGELAERYGFQYVILDLPPQMYHLVNPIVTVSADYFITPAVKGAFSDIAVKYMLETFYESIRTFRKEYSGLNYFLGVVLMRFHSNETINIARVKERIERKIREFLNNIDIGESLVFPQNYSPVFNTVIYYNSLLTKLRGSLIGRVPYIIKVLTGYFKGGGGEEIRKKLISNINELTEELENRVMKFVSSSESTGKAL
ncbi:MAG: ParA family protein [Desulfurococcaceae archaeon]|uniref:ParA family protein n=1 Tax=Staphylothermus marinus TaxID=2280 RepID=A0A7C4NNF6_STAMA